MAHLGNTLVNGDLKVLQNAAASSIQTDAIKVRTGASSTEYGVGTNGQVVKSNGTVAYWASDSNTDVNVTQTATTTSADYEVLFSVTADNTTRTEGARKNSNLKFNPNTGNLQTTQLNGVAIGNSPKFTDTTYAVMTSGTTGLVPASGTSTKYLRGDATWQTPDNTTYGTVTTAANGLAPKVTSTAAFLKGDGTWATPTNTTYAVMTSGTSGLVPASGTSAKYLRGDATWQTPDNTTYGVMTSGTTGLVPSGGTNAKYLRGDATWQTTAAFNTTYGVATTAANGLLSSTDKAKLDNYPDKGSDTTKYLRNDGQWAVPPDNNTTYAVMTSGTTGLVPSGGTNAKYLRGDATWQTTAAFNTTYGVMTSGTTGLVPASGTSAKYLRGDATWQTTAAFNTTYGVMTSGTSGLVPASGTSAKYLRGDATWQTPDNTTYSSKAEAEGGTDVSLVTTGDKFNWNHIHFGEIEPLVSKVYADSSYYATSNDWENATWYFMSVKPDAWYKPWKINLKVHTFCPAYATMESYTYSMICGREGATSYLNWNERYSAAHSYITCYPLKQAGFNDGYGHAIGISIYNADNRGSAYYRTFEIEYYECENCTVTFLDTPVKWASWTGTGTTNYGSLVSYDSINRGLMETGDTNTIENQITYFSGKTGTQGVWAGSLFMEDGNSRYQNICTASDGTATNSNRTTATTKKANTNGFRVGSPIWYCNGNYNANTNISNWGHVYKTKDAFDSRYSFNSTLTANFFTTYNPLYLVGTINSSDGLFYLDETWWTQTPNSTGKVYVLVGAVYTSSTTACQITLYEENRWFRYNGSRLVEIVDGYTVAKDVPANAVFTDTTYANVSTAAAGLAPKVTSTANFLKGDGTWATPTNTTYANVSTAAAGLAPKVTNTSNFLKGDGTWAVPTNTTYAVMTSGTSGLVPASGTSAKYLRGDATWQTPDNTTYGVMTSGTTGLVPSGGTNAKYLRGDATWQTTASFNTTYANVSTATAGLAPKVTNTANFLKGDGTWAVPTNTTYAVVSTAANGLAPKVTSTAAFLKGDGTWAAPTDTTYAVMTSGTSGLVPASGTSAKYLRGDATWQTTAAFNTTYAVMTSGTSGLVPASGTSAKYLRGDASWQTPPNDNTTYAVMTSGTSGLVPSGGTSATFLRGDATWAAPDGKTWEGTQTEYSQQTIDPATLYFVTPDS